MRAVLFREFGEPASVLHLGEVPLPTPGQGEVRVRMLASPVNPSDLMVVRGAYGTLPTLPATPGFEGVGIVDLAGPGLLGRFMLGKRVAVLNRERGNWCEQTVVPAKQVIPVSKQIPLEQAAMFFVNPATALVMTRKVLSVPAGAWLLQTAAGSALGRMVIRLGRRYGFRTLNVVRRPDQVADLQAVGGDAVIAAGPDDLCEKVREITEGKGVRYAIDPVGGPLASAVVRTLAPGGRLLIYGSLSGQPLAVSPRDLITPAASVEGFWLARWMQRCSLLGKLRLVRTIDRLIRAGDLAAEVGNTYPLDRVAEAVTDAEAPGRSGKILLRIADADPSAD